MAGESNDAVSAHAQWRMEDASRLDPSESPVTEYPHVWIILPWIWRQNECPNKPQCLTAVLKQRFSLLTLERDWKVLPAFIFVGLCVGWFSTSLKFQEPLSVIHSLWTNQRRVCFVPKSMLQSFRHAQLFMFEDSEAVARSKDSSPRFRWVCRASSEISAAMWFDHWRMCQLGCSHLSARQLHSHFFRDRFRRVSTGRLYLFGCRQLRVEELHGASRENNFGSRHVHRQSRYDWTSDRRV